MNTFIIISLTIIATIAIQFGLKKLFITDFDELSIMLESMKIDHVVFDKNTIHMLTEVGEVVEYQFDDKGKFISVIRL